MVADRRRMVYGTPLRWLLAFVVCGTTGCGTLARLTRPEGDGGWSREQRDQELAQRANAAGVEFGPPHEAGPTPAAIPPGPRGPLDLHAALVLAATGNRRIATAGKQVEAARARFLETRGRLLPTTLGTARYSWYSDPQTANVSLPGGALPPGSAPPVVKIRDADAGTVNGTITLPLDVSGEIRHLVSAAQAGYRGERARLWATTLDQQLRVVRAYYDVLEAQRLREVTLDTIALDREQLSVADSRFRNGRATKNDVLVVQVALQNAQQQLVQRDLMIDQARWALNEAIGAEVNAPTELVDVRQRPDVPAPAAALQLAYQHNPIFQALVEQQQQLEENIHALESSRLPRFIAGGAIDYSTSDLLLPQRIESGFTGVTWDLGTDTRRESQIVEARVAADSNRVEIERQMREIEAAVRSAQSAAEERLSALVAAETAVVQAAENLRIRQQQFDSGRAQSDDVLIAEALLAQQRAIVATALYQAHTRRAELQQLIGLSLDDVAVSQR
jgi:outer membrane protein TolC